MISSSMLLFCWWGRDEDRVAVGRLWHTRTLYYSIVECVVSSSRLLLLLSSYGYRKVSASCAATLRYRLLQAHLVLVIRADAHHLRSGPHRGRLSEFLALLQVHFRLHVLVVHRRGNAAAIDGHVVVCQVVSTGIATRAHMLRYLQS